MGIMKTDVVCPLYKADEYIDALLSGLKNQKGIEIVRGIFPVTKCDGAEAVAQKVLDAGFECFFVEKSEFSHSLTREKAIKDYCESDVVVMLSQDVKLIKDDALALLSGSVNAETVYAYGRQVCAKRNIEYYVRLKNYGDKSFIVTRDDVERLQLKAFFASDAFSAYYRPVFIALGGYDGINMMMSEDMYYAKKVIDNGYKKAYVAEAVVEHSHKFTLKQLYKRYYDTGVWFAEHGEFDNYKTNDTGLKLALSVFAQALKHFNIPVLLRFFPDMAARYFGMRKGKKAGIKASENKE